MAGKALALFVLGTLLTVGLASSSASEDLDFSRPGGGHVRFIGRSTKFEVQTAVNSSIRVSFGLIEELTADGARVNGHKITELASVKPVFEQGFVFSANEQNVTYVKLRLPLNETGLQYQTTGCAAPTVTQEEFNSGYVEVTALFGYTNDTIFDYGLNNTVVAAANTIKFNFQATNWPFCSANNTLNLDLVLKSSAGEDAKPLATNFTEAEEGTESAPAARHLRKLLDDSRKKGNDNTEKEQEGNKPEDADKKQGPKKRPPHQRDDRVKGFRTDRFALITDKASGQAATLDLETYAYDKVDGSTLYNVTSTMLQQGGDTVVRLTFPSFTSIYYDPTLDTGVNATTVGYSTSDLSMALTDDPETESTNTTAPKNAAGSARSGIMSALLSAVLLVAVLL